MRRCMMQARRGGYTLVEVLVSGAILALFITMVSHALVVAYRTFTVTSKKSVDFRQATVALERMTRELRAADKVYLPDPNVAPWSAYGFYTPEVGVNPPMIFRTYDASGPRVLGYRWDRTARTVQRLIYDPTFDPAATSTQNVLETKKVSWEADDFKIQRMDPSLTSGVPFLHVELKLGTVPNPIPMEVRLKSL